MYNILIPRHSNATTLSESQDSTDVTVHSDNSASVSSQLMVLYDPDMNVASNSPASISIAPTCLHDKRSNHIIL